MLDLRLSCWAYDYHVGPMIIMLGLWLSCWAYDYHVGPMIIGVSC